MVWMDGGTDGRTDGWMDVVVLQMYFTRAQIDNNQQVYEVQIQVSKCNIILKAGVKSSVHFILIDVRVSTQTQCNSPYIISVCCSPVGQDLAFG